MRLQSGEQAVRRAADLLARSCAAPALRSASGYRLYAVDDVIVVRFGPSPALDCSGAGALDGTRAQYWERRN